MAQNTAQKLDSVWISANAGSGKTTALTWRVLRLLLLGVIPERICCITYTKAGAAEMRQRVTRQLRALLVMNDEKLAIQVEKILGRAGTVEELSRARELFGAVLDSTTGGIQLTTIHGFCQRLLRSFPLEAGIAPYFTVLEDTEADQLVARAKHRLLSQTRDHELAAAIAFLAERSAERDFDQLVRVVLSQRGCWETIWSGQPPEVLKERLYAYHGLTADATEEDFVRVLCNALTEDMLTALHNGLAAMRGHSAARMVKLAEIMSRWCEVPTAQRPALLEGFYGTLLTKEGQLQSWIAKEKSFSEPVRAALMHLGQSVARFEEQSSALACAEDSYALAIMARALLDLYAQLKMERQALDYDDLILHTRRLLLSPDAVGWVMSKLDHRIDHLLVDEAQDTSEDQWSIARTLVDELIVASEGIGSANLPRTLLVVGDEKQSIFSFQGANPDLLAVNEAYFTQRLMDSPAPLKRETLATSYRSAPAILKLVDTVAGLPEVQTSLSAVGEAVPHALARKKAVGKVRLYPITLPQEKQAPAPFMVPTEYQITRSAPQLLAEEVAAQIDDWLREKHVLESEGRPIRAGDILILVYRRKPFVGPLIRALENKGLPVAGLDRLRLAEHLAIRDLLVLMEWTGHTGNDLALAQILRSPLIGLSDEELREIAVKREGISLWHRLETLGHPSLSRLQHWLAISHAAPYEFLTQVLEVGDARRQFAARFGEEVHEVLDELKAQAGNLPRGVSPNLASFAQWIRESEREIKREQGDASVNHIRIMTVHGAKGLESPIVMLIDTARVPETGREQFFTACDAANQTFPLLKLSPQSKSSTRLEEAKARRLANQFAEYHRLLYVALTRPRDELHIFAAGNAKGEVKSGSWYQLAREAMQRAGAKDEHGVLTLSDVAGTSPVPSRAEPMVLPATLPEWLKPVPAVAGRNRIAPSRLADASLAPFSRARVAGAKERGVRIHRMLEFLHPGIDRATLNRLVAVIAPDWDAKSRGEVATELWDLFAGHRWLWESPAQAEISISGDIEIGGQSVAVNGQIDRLIYHGEAIVILDYKTGATVPSKEGDVPANYLLQLKTYQALLRQIYPDRPIRTAILWTSEPRLMWLDSAVENAVWQLPEALTA